MKVQTLKRPLGNVQRECSGDLKKHARNVDPQYHPMQRSREYQRAVTAAKMSRMFAQPLIGNLGQGHRDAVICSAVSRRALLPLVSGSADGTVKVWDLASRATVANLEGAHTRTVTGLTFDLSGQVFYSCSDDGYMHRWNIHASVQPMASAEIENRKKNSKGTISVTTTTEALSHGPTQSWRIQGSFKSLDHHWSDPNQFATASDHAIQIWTPERTTATATFDNLWGNQGHDTVTVCRYNPAETSLLAHCSSDRGIGLHDTRTRSALKKTVLQMRSNDLQWNPMEPMVFAVANEDGNAYTFDMRQMERPMRMFQGHTGAVMTLAWSPTGREFVTGSYDRTVRIFQTKDNRAREIYHTKRMQRIWTVQYSADNKFIVTGSDDSNLRLWKARASEQVGQQLKPREEAAVQYRAALIQKYQHTPKVRQIYKSRRIPKVIRNQTKQAAIQKASAQRKESNRIEYGSSKTKSHDTNQPKYKAERDKTVVKAID